MSTRNMDQEVVEADVAVVAEEVTATLAMMILMKAAMAFQEGLPEALEEASPAEAVEVVAAVVIVKNLLSSL